MKSIDKYPEIQYEDIKLGVRHHNSSLDRHKPVVDLST